MRWRVLVLTCCVALTGCATLPADDPADVSLHLQQRLDETFNPGPGGIDRPAATPVRFALPQGWGNLMHRCMNDAGFTTVDFDREDGFTNVATSGAGALAWYHCTQKLPQYDTVFAEFSDAELDELYDYYVEVLVPCAGALGVSVTELPSRASFGDGGEGQPGWWHPFLSVELPPSAADVDLLFAKCPPYPDSVRP
jgi:hypothetical protein